MTENIAFEENVKSNTVIEFVFLRLTYFLYNRPDSEAWLQNKNFYLLSTASTVLSDILDDLKIR